ncbi:hypothetical protein PC128_g7404 [Phytophthora cactorum]|nr:hypothetical protein PC128_g7404 [Phytophthora cactorum]
MRKASPKAGSKKSKKPKTTSPHVAEGDGDGDGDASASGASSSSTEMAAESDRIVLSSCDSAWEPEPVRATRPLIMDADLMYESKKSRGEEETRDNVLLRETKSHKKIQPDDILHCIGLLVARMLCPHKRRFTDHWATTANLHFTNNADVRAETDRAWKVRSVVDTLQETFLKGYMAPPVLSFDEPMIPSRSRHNITRQFMKDKPHKWETKLFMTCCADTAYCLR